MNGFHQGQGKNPEVHTNNAIHLQHCTSKASEDKICKRCLFQKLSAFTWTYLLGSDRWMQGRRRTKWLLISTQTHLTSLLMVFNLRLQFLEMASLWSIFLILWTIRADLSVDKYLIGGCKETEPDFSVLFSERMMQ